MNIFLISGFSGAGKSTVARQLLALRPASQLTAFAKTAKDWVACKYGIDRELFDTQEGKAKVVESAHGIFNVRDLLIIHAEAAKQRHGKDVWAKGLVDEIKSKPEIQDWIVEDWRFPNEYTVLREAFWSAKIHRIRVVNNTVTAYNKDEQLLATEPIHVILDNTQFKCEEQVKQFVGELL